MTIENIKKELEEFYKKIYKNEIEIVDVDLDNYTYKIKIGDCESKWFKFSKEIIRELKLEKILN